MSSLKELQAEIIKLETRIERTRARLRAGCTDKRFASLDTLEQRERVLKAEYARAFLRSVVLY